MPFIGIDGLPEWRVTLQLARDTRPEASPMFARTGDSIRPTAAGLLSTIAERTGDSIQLVSSPVSDNIFQVTGNSIQPQP